MGGTQTGKTEIMVNADGFSIVHDQCPMMNVFPNGQLFADFSVQRLKSMIQGTPSSRERMSEEKSRVTNIREGFDFLGMSIRKRGKKLLLAPSAKNVKRLRESIREIANKNRAAAAYILLRKLNPLLRGWTNYYRHVCSSTVFRATSNYLHQTLMRWARRRHSNKGRPWLVRKYFRTSGNRNWVFFGTSPDGVITELSEVSHARIWRHIKVRSDLNPYASEWQDYIEKRSSSVKRRTRPNTTPAPWRLRPAGS